MSDVVSVLLSDNRAVALGVPCVDIGAELR